MKKDNEEFEDLGGKILMGEATPNDERRLDALMESQPELRQRFVELKAIFKAPP